MKILIRTSLVTIIVLGLILSVGCADKDSTPYQVDRQIQGKVIAIDSHGDFSTLYYRHTQQMACR